MRPDLRKWANGAVPCTIPPQTFSARETPKETSRLSCLPLHLSRTDTRPVLTAAPWAESTCRLEKRLWVIMGAMKSADIELGREYLSQTVGHRARITVLAPPAHARVQVSLSEGSAWTGESWIEAGEVGSVACRDVVAPWEQWAEAHSDDLPLRSRSEVQAAENQARDLALLIDPDRHLRRAYEPADTRWDFRPDRFSPTLTGEGSAAVWRSGLPATRASDLALAPLLEGLPGPVARDLIAAFVALRSGETQREPSIRLTDLPDAEHVGYAWSRRESAGAGPARVRDVFARAAGQLTIAYDDAHGALHRYRYPGIEVLTKDDIAFYAAAVSDEQRTHIQELCGGMPAHLVDSANREVVTALGWIPIVAGVSSGQKVHRPGCRSFREERSTLADGTVRPLWYYASYQWNDFCSTCEGPLLGAPAVMAHFLAASDSWSARGRPVELEAWQRRAASRIVGIAVGMALDPDPAVQLTTKLIQRFGVVNHGERGWKLYRALVYNQNATDLTAAEYAHLRIEAESLVADALVEAGATPAGSSGQKLAVLEDNGVPHAARVLFTLPGATR